MTKPTVLESLIIILCLFAGNLIYQYFQSMPDYSVALERAYFNGVGVICAYFV